MTTPYNSGEGLTDERPEGHCDDDATWAHMAPGYLGPRNGKLTDFQVAYEIAMTMRDDLNFEGRLQTAKDRIRWLSVHLAIASEALRASRAREAELSSPELRERLARIIDPHEWMLHDFGAEREPPITWGATAGSLLKAASILALFAGAE